MGVPVRTGVAVGVGVLAGVGVQVGMGVATGVGVGWVHPNGMRTRTASSINHFTAPFVSSTSCRFILPFRA